jgi:hypothetical protein
MVQAEVAEAWGEWVVGLREWHLFGGLTFDQRRVPSEKVLGVNVPRVISRDVAGARFREWIRRSEGVLQRRVDYVAAMESQRNGWPHFHPLLDLGRLGDGDIETLGRLWYEANGYGRLEVPRDRAAVCSYSAKYLAKDLGTGDVLMSRGLGRFVPFQMPWERG